jgi:hypothetical protein
MAETVVSSAGEDLRSSDADRDFFNQQIETLRARGVPASEAINFLKSQIPRSESDGAADFLTRRLAELGKLSASLSPAQRRVLVSLTVSTALAGIVLIASIIQPGTNGPRLLNGPVRDRDIPAAVVIAATATAEPTSFPVRSPTASRLVETPSDSPVARPSATVTAVSTETPTRLPPTAPLATEAPTRTPTRTSAPTSTSTRLGTATAEPTRTPAPGPTVDMALPGYEWRWFNNRWQIYNSKTEQPVTTRVRGDGRVVAEINGGYLVRTTPPPPSK